MSDATIMPARSAHAAGYGALLLAVLIWGGWMPATRLAANSGIAPMDVALLRYAVPALVLLPVVIRLGPKLRSAPLWTLLGIFGWGAPFVFCISGAMETASVAHVAALVPCTMPLLAVTVERVFLGIRVARWQMPGFALIGLCAALVLCRVLFSEAGTSLASVGLLLLASMGWGAFTLSFRRSGLTAIEATAFNCAISGLVVLPIVLFGDSTLPNVSWEMIAFHTFAQGIASGIIATVAYSFAIGRLGTARSSASGVMVPVLATLIAFLWLGEAPAPLDMVALTLGTIGVAIVNGVFHRPPKDQKGIPTPL